jgi:predicted RNA-binding protein
MRDVARIEAEAKGFRLIDLFGNTVFIEGSIQIVDLVDEHYVIIEKN